MLTFTEEILLLLLDDGKLHADPISGSGLTTRIFGGRLERACQSVAGSKFHGRSSSMRDCGWPSAIFSSVLCSQA